MTGKYFSKKTDRDYSVVCPSNLYLDIKVFFRGSDFFFFFWGGGHQTKKQKNKKRKEEKETKKASKVFSFQKLKLLNNTKKKNPYKS